MLLQLSIACCFPNLTSRSKGLADRWRLCKFVVHSLSGLRLTSVSGQPLTVALGLVLNEGAGRIEK